MKIMEFGFGFVFFLSLFFFFFLRHFSQGRNYPLVAEGDEKKPYYSLALTL